MTPSKRPHSADSDVEVVDTPLNSSRTPAMVRRSDRLQKSPTAGASTGPSYILFGSRKGRLFDPSNTGQSSTPFRSKKSSLDGDFVPWSVPKNAWDNIKTLEIIRMELRRYLYIVNNRIEALNPREPSPNTFWDTVAESYKDIEVGLELDKLKDKYLFVRDLRSFFVDSN
ncbi:uncharacterized protein ATNIH1004_005323 [Aspergillus tanneri]|uniref:Uncharacterized protein n=1 Tax=Aspergillus tanneri TaxID=1220188 RepID=A0A5M9MI57_9EURO|nr:uncharacterized protein ATNIH1004_005323 [Aspergillus tanneri]KAA8646648.1 hypothetical protein ATNIH1004_005323 [Aspergillus tanneri]